MWLKKINACRAAGIYYRFKQYPTAVAPVCKNTQIAQQNQALQINRKIDNRTTRLWSGQNYTIWCMNMVTAAYLHQQLCNMTHISSWALYSNTCFKFHLNCSAPQDSKPLYVPESKPTNLALQSIFLCLFDWMRPILPSSLTQECSEHQDQGAAKYTTASAALVRAKCVGSKIEQRRADTQIKHLGKEIHPLSASWNGTNNVVCFRDPPTKSNPKGDNTISSYI